VSASGSAIYNGTQAPVLAEEAPTVTFTDASIDKELESENPLAGSDKFSLEISTHSPNVDFYHSYTQAKIFLICSLFRLVTKFQRHRPPAIGRSAIHTVHQSHSQASSNANPLLADVLSVEQYHQFLDLQIRIVIRPKGVTPTYGVAMVSGMYHFFSNLET
jgi:hypothetical protein